MKKQLNFLLIIFVGIVLVSSCKRDIDIDSIAKPIVLPFIIDTLMEDSYVYGLGQATLLADLPDVVAIAVDTVFGLEGGYGGRTGSDTIKIMKNQMISQPDLNKVGGSSITYQVYNKGGYRVSVSSNVVIAGPIPDPGPDDLSGFYDRINLANNMPTGYILELTKVFDGVYIIGNPGGAASVAFRPYLLYNHSSPNGENQLRFPVQEDNCHGGLRLVSLSAPVALTAGEYDAYPPAVTSKAPITLEWKVFEFSSATNSAVHPNGALCAWGLGPRKFVKR